MKHRYSLFGKKSLKTIAIVLSSTTVAFLVGIQTAGDFHSVTTIQADGTDVMGDFNGNGLVDIQDARIALELASGFRSPTPQELSADPNRDFSITTADVLSILHRLERSPVTPKIDL